MRKTYDVLIVGSLINFDLVLAEHLARKGLKCCVVRKRGGREAQAEAIGVHSGFHTHYDPKEIIWVDSVFEFLRLAYKSRLIASFTAELKAYLRYWWLLRDFLGLPPVIGFSTGSDITELAGESGLRATLMRQYLRFVDINVMPMNPPAFKNIIGLGLKNTIFTPYSYYYPEAVKLPERKPRKASDPLIFFHASRLDWKQSDSRPTRTSSKGNDRFFLAFARAINEGLNAECWIAERGSDKVQARALITKLGLDAHVKWLPHMDRDALVETYLACDVVVDHFDLGGYGGIAIEAMALGKPVMIYINEKTQRLFAPDMPPILNARTENELYEQIMLAKQPGFLEDLGAKANEWMKLHYSWETCVEPFLFYFTVLTGHQVVDYGWDLDHYQDE